MSKKIPLLQVEGLSISSQERLLLNGLSFEINTNEIVAIVGESGSGKSLTALSIAGLWDEWINKKTGELFNSFSIITTKANQLMQKIHNNPKLPEGRMPVIINNEEEDQWLKAENKNDCSMDQWSRRILCPISSFEGFAAISCVFDTILIRFGAIFGKLLSISDHRKLFSTTVGSELR